MAKSNPTTVLVVDNDQTNRYLMRSILEPNGFRVDTVKSVAEALAALAESQPDLIITDLHMPGRSGFELVRAVRADPALSHIPIMMTSATQANLDDEGESLRLGVNRFITNPLEPDLVLRAIKECLAGKAK